MPHNEGFFILRDALPLGIVFLSIGILLVLALWFSMAWALVHPPRMTDGKAAYLLKRLSPMDLGLEFEEIRFEVADQKSVRPMNLAGWWMPADDPKTDRCVILVHGYADAKVGSIAWGPLFHELNYHILAIDLRGHGESDGTVTTAGYFERHDLNQVINQLRERYPQQSRELVLFGISMGAAIIAATAVMRDDLSAVILECPYADFRQAAAAHGYLMGLPLAGLQKFSIRLAQVLIGADFGVVRPVDLIPRIGCALMVIQAGDDPLVGLAEMDALKGAMESRPANLTEYWRIEGVGHVLGMAAGPEEYGQRVKRFLDRK
jgi:pimeloyl-ACP methyl ester carboxylesterase